MMSHIFRRAAQTTAALLLAILVQGAPARANIVFDFSGTCTSGCDGTATGVLTLSNSYQFGANITKSTFISFTYASDNQGFHIISPNLTRVEGGLNADGSLSFAVEFDGPNLSTFPNFTLGETSQFIAAAGLEEKDIGDGAFTLVSSPVPEPSTWAMLLVGFAGLGYVGYRRTRQGAVAPA